MNILNSLLLTRVGLDSSVGEAKVVGAMVMTSGLKQERVYGSGQLHICRPRTVRNDSFSKFYIS